MVDECEAVRAGHSYSLAASIIPSDRLDTVRDAVTALTPRNRSKLHWHDAETTERRLQLVQLVADLDAIEHVAVVLSTRPAERPERRRRHCLGRLLPELHDLGVSRVTAEAREAKQNQRDRQFLDGLRAQGLVPATLRLDHRPGPAEPALAVADIVAGAVLASYSGDGRFRKVVEHKLTELVIDP
ncbi:hypothetical protein SAMN04488563_5034 [Jiangella alkaliphila]|uniref:Uncharacterized protein n=2 Tax=Jiangella alkaliphila TaxID=419479 RepID=A0A1H2L5L8_9ACTN|nr:hypothetical protein SAMN04488563_5034 [Jiangella alkaliphila]